MPRLMILIASTRPGRVGLPVAEWFRGRVEKHGAFDVDWADMDEIALPFMDEPNHPRLQRYEHQHTKDWSARVAAADAFAFVLPEYNHGYGAVVKNAMDYLHHEWKHKALGIVSYGGVSAGLRGVAALKPSLVALQLNVAFNAVNIPFVAQFIDDEGELKPNDTLQEASLAMLDELVKLDGALRTLRER
jgi:NAD(P)H-dependent FMN reductase